MWEDHVEALIADGKSERSVVWETIRSSFSHLHYRTRRGSPTFLPVGFGLLFVGFGGLATSMQGASAPQRPVVYLHLSAALFTLALVFIARPAGPSPVGMRIGSILLGSALVHLTVGYDGERTTDLMYYPASTAMFVGCCLLFAWSFGIQKHRLANLTCLLFTFGLVSFVLLIVGRSFGSSSSAFSVTFLLTGFAAALVANFLLRCRAWPTMRT